MIAITYRDVARQIARAKTDEERADAGVVLVLYDRIGRESPRERMAILHQELVAALRER
jgi:hypothetical protein